MPQIGELTSYLYGVINHKFNGLLGNLSICRLEYKKACYY
jgi:hypothetical protein